jgi:hypothetical protein
MTVAKRDWRMQKGGKFNMLKKSNKGADENKRKGPKRLKPHLLPFQIFKD